MNDDDFMTDENLKKFIKNIVPAIKEYLPFVIAIAILIIALALMYHSHNVEIAACNDYWLKKVNDSNIYLANYIIR